MNAKFLVTAAAIALCGLMPHVAPAATATTALTVADNFTGANSQYDWQTFNGACLTAGDGTGTIPTCVSLPYYGSEILVGGYNGYLGTTSSPTSAATATPDPVGNGALRFTNGYPHGYSQNGAIVSNFTYPSSEGLQVTFTTVTYLGNSGGAGGDGADGISFFLMDGAKAPDIGAWGGSLGYSCSNANAPYRGINGGYIGLGIDEYGNFLNGTSLMPGYSGSNSASGDNTAWGYGYKPGRIGLRGAGDVTWGVLNAAYGTDPGNTAMPYYPATLATACTSGFGVLVPSQPAPNQCATTCPAGNYVAGTNTCDTCSSGTWVASTTSCNTCSTGTFVSSTNTCNTCPAGENYITASNVCAYCPSGVYYNQKCYSCSSGVINAGSPPNCIDICATNYLFEPNGTCYSCKATVGGALNSSVLIWNGSAASCPTGYSLKSAAPTTAAATNVAATTAAPTQNPPTLNAPVQGAPNYGATTDLRPTAVQKTCKTGQLWNYTAVTTPTSAGTTTLTNTANTAGVLDYYPIPNAYQELPSAVQIANESVTKRALATPITYKLKITSTGLLSFWYSYNGGAYQTVIQNQDITASNGPLPQNFRFGFGGSTGGSSNVHEIMCFNAVPADTSSSSAGLNQKESAKVQTGSQVYFAFYNPNTWAGSLTSNNLNVDPSTGVLTIASAANWDASCVLTGVPSGQTCFASGVAGPVAAQSPGSRAILTWSGSQGVPFEWGSLTNAQQTALNVGDASPGTPDRLNFLRGDRSNELTSAGVGEFRDRTSVLGDIVDSSPTWVGAPSFSYADTWQDLLSAGSTPENSGQAYSAYISSFQTRLNVVYSGANDGLLHGFRSGVYSTPTTYDGTLNDGKEVLAYMPGASLAGVALASGAGSLSVADTIHGTDPTNSNALTAALDYSNPQYGHNFYVDATPGTGDVFINGQWHTWLVGGMGPGGAAIFALDVTDPSQFSEGNASSLVMGEWNPTTLTCVGNGGCGANLGNTYGVPQIRRFHNGMWGAVFGNGLGSSTGDAGVYVMTIDPSSGSISFYYLSTGMTGTGDGIAYVTAADLDGDHTVDYLYAGDVLGNVWKFDVTRGNPAQWAVTGNPLFTTPSGQPITTQVLVVSVPSTAGAAPRIMVDFGTGQKTPLTNFSATTYASGTQYLYGIWDWNVSAWNAMSRTPYAALTGAYTITAASLVAQTASDVGGGLRTLTSNPVCWQGSTACGSGNSQFGWKLPLPDSSPGTTSSSPVQPEQVVFSPIFGDGAFIVNTTIPGSTSPMGCTSVLPNGWTMAINAATGGAFATSFFANSSGNFVTVNNKVVSGIQLAGTGSPSLVTTGTNTTGSNSTKAYLITQTSSGTPTSALISPPAGTQGGRLNWIQRR